MQERIERLSVNKVAAATMTFQADIDYDEVLANYDDLKKEVDVLVTKRIESNAKLKEIGRAREWKTDEKEEKERFMTRCNAQKAARNASNFNLVKLSNNLKDCKVKEIGYNSKNTDPSIHQVLNHIESVVSKNVKQKSRATMRETSKTTT